jgi:hypothetical protein
VTLNAYSDFSPARANLTARDAGSTRQPSGTSSRNSPPVPARAAVATTFTSRDAPGANRETFEADSREIGAITTSFVRLSAPVVVSPI